MGNFRKMIVNHAEVMNNIQQKVHESARNRSHDPQSWQDACKEFRLYISKLDYLIDRIFKSKILKDKDVMEFSISFLELNPMYFRSGYIKEEILRKIKRSPLSKDQLIRLINVLKDAVDQRGTREFKKYCKLAFHIADQQLADYINQVIRTDEGAKKSRAKLMWNSLQYKVID